VTYVRTDSQPVFHPWSKWFISHFDSNYPCIFYSSVWFQSTYILACTSSLFSLKLNLFLWFTFDPSYPCFDLDLIHSVVMFSLYRNPRKYINCYFCSFSDFVFTCFIINDLISFVMAERDFLSVNPSDYHSWSAMSERKGPFKSFWSIYECPWLCSIMHRICTYFCSIDLIFFAKISLLLLWPSFEKVRTQCAQYCMVMESYDVTF
jgi:hypothetical protein